MLRGFVIKLKENLNVIRGCFNDSVEPQEPVNDNHHPIILTKTHRKYHL